MSAIRTRAKSLGRKVIRGHNFSLAESTANTYKDQAFELPGTEGAKGVLITSIVLDTEAPDEEASQDNLVKGGVLLGDVTSKHSSMPYWGTDDVIAYVQERIVCDADTFAVMFYQNSPLIREGLKIPLKPDQGGQFYLTGAVCGTGNAIAKSIQVRVEYIVVY